MDVMQKSILHCAHQLKSLATAAMAIATCLPLSGCVHLAGIDPQSKPIAAQQLDAGKNIASAAAMEWPKENWWQAYQDPQLNALVAQAMAESPTLRMAQARVHLSASYAQSAHAETLPNASIDASVTRERFTALQFIPPPWGGNTEWNNQATASLAYDLDLWGRQESLWHAALDETRATAAEAQQVRLGLTTAIVRSYVQLAMEHTLRDIAEQQRHEVQERISITRRSLAAGLGTQMEVLEAETALPLANAEIEAIDARIRLLHNQLAALTGKGPGGGDGITRPALTLDATIGLPDQLPANLIGRRPDVLAHRWRVEAAQQNIEGAKAAFYPNINLLAFVGFQALGFGQLISSAAGIAGVGPAVSLPMFDGGRRRGNLSAKTASYDIAVENYNEVVVRALQDVSDQLVVLQSNSRQNIQAEQSLTTAIKAHDMANASYRAGLSNFMHVLHTHEVVLRQQENIAHLQAVRLDAYAELMRALGGGLIDPTTTATEKP